MLINATLVKKPRKKRHCALCNKAMPPGEPQMRLYGSAHRGDKPYRIYVCPPCHDLSEQARKAARGGN
jgi:hypothetical protein